MQLQGVQKKKITIHCNPIPPLTYIAVRYLQSSQRNANIQSILLVVLATERWQFFVKKTQYFINTLYLPLKILQKKNNIL